MVAKFHYRQLLAGLKYDDQHMERGERVMASQGILYTVKGPRGSYYAIHDPATGLLRTERTEEAARAQARDMDIRLVDQEIVSHEELLRRTGREMPETLQPKPRQSHRHVEPAEITVANPLSEIKRDDLVLQSVALPVKMPLFASEPLPAQDLAPGAPPLDAFSTGEIVSSALLPTSSDADSNREPTRL